jgi:asparagine synthase (glutamine-hydrolysing)
VEKRCAPRTGIVFSGGVDSTLVAYTAARYSDVTAYVVGVEGSPDLEYADRIAKEAPFPIKAVRMRLEDVEAAVPEILSAWGKPNPLDVGVGIPMYMASKAAAEDGHTIMLCGQGGDELFGGYWRYLESMVKAGPDSVAAWMEADWGSAYADNLDRDIAMNASNGCELRFPFLDSPFSKYVRAMPLDLKIREGGDMACDEVAGRRFVRKYALKKLAVRMGVPVYVADRVKKAAQYGSGSQKALDRLARTSGWAQKARSAGRDDYLKMFLEDAMEKNRASVSKKV